MLFYYCFFSSTLALAIFLLIYSFVMLKRNIPIELFVKALSNENSGHFEDALIAYELALDGFRKTKYQNNLKNKIIEKLKVLRTVIEHKNNFH